MKKNEKIIVIVCIITVILGFAIVFGIKGCSVTSIANKIISSSEMPEATGMTNEITNVTTVEETFINDSDSISQLALVFNVASEYEKLDNVTINVSLYDGDTALVNKNINVCDIKSQHRLFIDLGSNYIGMSGKEMKLIISTDCSKTGLQLMIQENESSTFKFGNMVINGTICFTLD